MQKGDRVALKDGDAADAAVIKNISDGGTVTTRYAIAGRRCFSREELTVVQSFTFHGTCPACECGVEVTLRDCMNPEAVVTEFDYKPCPNCEHPQGSVRMKR